jgi:diaminohydroxyphosphoribosylaminopyrimidine deaminase/5-amino-6-(5-phosphoribosylamino)uracil reductase
VVTDNPHLIPRGEFAGFTRNPIRVICGEQELPADSQIFDDKAQTVVVKSKDLKQLVAKLNELELNQVFVEAGSTFASALMAAGLIDELVIYQAPALLGAGKSFYQNEDNKTIEDLMRLKHISTEVLAGDLKSVYLVAGGI